MSAPAGAVGQHILDLHGQPAEPDAVVLGVLKVILHRWWPPCILCVQEGRGGEGQLTACTTSTQPEAQHLLHSKQHQDGTEGQLIKNFLVCDGDPPTAGGCGRPHHVPYPGVLHRWEDAAQLAPLLLAASIA